MIINQPYDYQLGVDLIEKITNPSYHSLTIMVAYAKLSGVYRLLPYMNELKKRNGKLRCIVGIDQQNTTYDALYQLNSIMDELYVFHSESFSQTFHVKCYWLSGESDIWYAIGSNNLTAGGLFSNYEMCITNHLSGDESTQAVLAFESIFNSYVTNAPSCCHLVSDAFLSSLLNNGYVNKELELRKTMMHKAQEQHATRSTKKQLFGKEVFTAPTLPTEYRTKQFTTKGSSSPQKIVSKEILPQNNSSEEKNYLIRFVPGAGNRAKQVHFTIDLLKNYFMLDVGDTILFQEMYPSGTVSTLEHRQIVFSQANKNVKIELKGAEILNTNYPTDLDKRPILVVKRINSNLFTYMLLMDGNDGYDSINTHLKSLPKRRSLAYEVISESTMFDLWDSCPLM